MTSSRADVDQVSACKAAGLTDRETSRITGVPIGTIKNWRHRGTPRICGGPPCPDCGAVVSCGGRPKAWEGLDPSTYNYLLGIYLGDGHLRRWGRGWTLRVSLDTAYPEIIAECSAAVAALRGREPTLRPDYGGSACLNVESSWVGWPCLIPQHGHGRKHSREIALTDWQGSLVRRAPGALLRGLIHSDGWRGVNKVHAKGRDYEYPRYQFSNRSDDIRRIFTDACDLLGIEWRQWTRYHVSVAKRESVARLDEHVGPKR